MDKIGHTSTAFNMNPESHDSVMRENPEIVADGTVSARQKRKRTDSFSAASQPRPARPPWDRDMQYWDNHSMRGHFYGVSHIHGGTNVQGDINGTLNIYSESSDTQKRRFLDSLYYPEMNSRLNDIKRTEYNTFEWIFKGNWEISELENRAEAQESNDEMDDIDPNPNKIVAYPGKRILTAEANANSKNEESNGENPSISALAHNREDVGNMTTDINGERESANDSVRFFHPDSHPGGGMIGNDDDDSSSLAISDVDSIESVFIGGSEQGISTCAKLMQWLRNKDGIFLIQGKAGSGKSTFMKFLVKHPAVLRLLENQSGAKKVVRLFHAFWLAGTELQRNYKGFLASVIIQIYEHEPNLRCVLLAMQSQPHKRLLNDWDEDELECLLREITEELKNNICLFIDGLDEFDHNGDIHRLFKWMRAVLKHPARKWKICLSSRPVIHILEEFLVTPQLKLQDITRDDILAYVSGTLQERLDKKRHRRKLDILAQIAHEVCEKADGVFLWVYFVLRNVCFGLAVNDDLDMLLKRIQQLPSEISALLEHMWASQTVNHSLHSEETFQLLSLAQFLPLPLFHMTVAMSPELQAGYFVHAQTPDNSELKVLCKNFSKRVSALSGGFLEIGRLVDEESKANDDYCFGWACRNVIEVNEVLAESTDQPSWRLCQVQVFHRSVYDFLFGTAGGRTIAKLDDESSLASAKLTLVRACLAGYMQGLCPMDLYEILDIILILSTVDEILHLLLGLNRFMTMEKSHNDNWVYDAWIMSQEGERPWIPTCIDFNGLAVACLQTRAALIEFLEMRQEGYCAYYLGYLAMCRFGSVGWDTLTQSDVEIFVCLLQHGADMMTPQTIHSRGPYFHARSPIIQLVAAYFHALLQKNPEPETKQLVGVMTSFQAHFEHFKPILARECFTMYYNVWDPDPEILKFSYGHQFQYLGPESITIAMVFNALDVLQVINGLAEDVLPVWRHDNAVSSLFRGLVRDVELMIYREGWQFYTVPHDKEVSILDAIFDNKTELESKVEPLLTELCETSLSESTSQRPDRYKCNYSINLPRPLDPSQEVVDGQWKKVCTMRDYFAELE